MNDPFPGSDPRGGHGPHDLSGRPQDRVENGAPGASSTSEEGVPQVRTDASRQRPRRGRAPLIAGVVGAAVLLGALSLGTLQRDPAPAADSAATTTPTAPATPGSTTADDSTTADGSTTAPGDTEALIASMQRREKDDPLAIGRVDAPVVLIEFSDWRCPFCAQWARTTRPELQKYVDDGTLRMEYRDMPIFGAESELAARAGRAAARQGRFWPFYDVVYGAAPERGHLEVSPEKLTAFARRAGVADLEKFDADMRSVEVAAEISRDLADARRLGAPNSVPLFLIGNEAISGAQPTEVFVQAVERQAATAQ